MSDDFIVGFRMAVDQCLTGGLGPDELIEVARSLASTGAIDLFSVSGGTGATRLSTAYFVPGDELPEGVFNERARRFREAVGVPVIVAGRNVEPAMADACVAERRRPGRDDARDHRRPRPAREGPRRPGRAAVHRAQRGVHRPPVHRSADVVLGQPGHPRPGARRARPGRDGGARRRRRRRSGRAGGGTRRPRSAVTRVVLFERRPQLGGRARLAGARRGRERWARYIDWLQDEAQAAGAELRTGVAATAQEVLAEAPDAVILATGSELRPAAALPGPVPAIDVDALLESGVPRVRARSALVLDDEGGFLAPTAAERLVAEGFTVEIATTHPVVGAEIDPTQQPFVLRRLALAGVAMTPHLSGVSSDADGVTLRNIYTERDERREGVGLVVMAGYRRAVVDLRDQLTAPRPDLRLVVAGDALAPRTLLDAVAEGARAGAEV